MAHKPYLTNFVFILELRSQATSDGPSHSIQDPVKKFAHIFPTLILGDGYDEMRTRSIRNHHLSWTRFCEIARMVLGEFSEIGWIEPSQGEGLPARYKIIENEHIFNNAVGILYNNDQARTNSTFTFYAWKDKPLQPINFPSNLNSGGEVPTSETNTYLLDRDNWYDEHTIKNPDEVHREDPASDSDSDSDSDDDRGSTYSADSDDDGEQINSGILLDDGFESSDDDDNEPLSSLRNKIAVSPSKVKAKQPDGITLSASFSLTKKQDGVATPEAATSPTLAPSTDDRNSNEPRENQPRSKDITPPISSLPKPGAREAGTATRSDSTLPTNVGDRPKVPSLQSSELYLGPTPFIAGETINTDSSKNRSPTSTNARAKNPSSRNLAEETTGGSEIQVLESASPSGSNHPTSNENLPPINTASGEFFQGPSQLVTSTSKKPARQSGVQVPSSASPSSNPFPSRKELPANDKNPEEPVKTTNSASGKVDAFPKEHPDVVSGYTFIGSNREFTKEYVVDSLQMKIAELEELESLDEAPVQYSGESDEAFRARYAEWTSDQSDKYLRKMQVSFEGELCEHVNWQAWLKCCEFLGHNPERSNALKKDTVKLYGFGIELLPVQAWSLYWCLSKKHGIEHSMIIGHEPGIGKTIIALALFHTQELLNVKWDHVRAHPSDHWQEGKDRRRCPSETKTGLKKWKIHCPCAPESPSHFVKPTDGFALTVVPATLVTNWHQEATKKCYPTEEGNVLGINIIRAHDCDISRSDLNKLLAIPSPMETHDKTRAPKYPKMTPNPDARKCFVITSSHSCSNKVTELLMRTYTSVQKVPDKRHKTRQGVYTGKMTKQPDKTQSITFICAIMSTIFVDEFHAEHKDTSRSPKIIRDLLEHFRRIHRKDEQPSIIILSGTPFTSGPGDLTYWWYLMAQASPGWREHEVLSEWENGKLGVSLAKGWEQEIKTGQITEQTFSTTVKMMSPMLEATMIRYTAFSKFFGHAIVKIPKHVISEKFVALSPEYYNMMIRQREKEDKKIAGMDRKKFKNWVAKGNQPRDFVKPPRMSHYHRSRLYASFPYLMSMNLERMREDGEPLKLTKDEWAENIKSGKWVKGDPNKDPYFQNIQKIYESSSKLQAFKGLWDKHKNDRDATKDFVRFIFCSNFFVGTYIIKLFFEHILKVAPDNMVYVDQSVLRTKREEVFNTFHGYTGRFPQIMVATTTCFAMGLTFANTVHLCVLEPDFKRDATIQCFWRTCRQGNKNPTCFTSLYLTKGSSVETKIMKVNKMRERITVASGEPSDPDDKATSGDRNKQVGNKEKSGKLLGSGDMGDPIVIDG